MPHTTSKRADPKGQADWREQLFNAGEIGPITAVSIPEANIVYLRAIMLDIDASLFAVRGVPRAVSSNPTEFYRLIVAPMLARHPVLSKAEVRCSGRGLHAILRFDDPIEFRDEPDRARWSFIAKVIQRLLPTDPDAPGITALTRPIGSINSKNGVKVKRLAAGKPIAADEVLQLFEEVRAAPVKSLLTILFGSDRVTPCPLCDAEGSVLSAASRVATCYGSCGQVRVERLYDYFLVPRRSLEAAQ